MRKGLERHRLPAGATLVTSEEAAELMGVSARMVLMLPIRQIRIGAKTIRFRLQDIYDFLGIDNPNL
jgi:hypothetical protein